MPRNDPVFCKYQPAHQVVYKKCSQKRNTITCPVCHFTRLIDTGQRTVSTTYKPGDEDYENADYYQKCHSCGTEIGIKKL